ncbi:MAG: DNA mismatch endonuclease Vsr [Chloroflexi bacterium]|nr:DNA mismatch endonuclease Vsr [Chloroflexota bacterium]
MPQSDRRIGRDHLTIRERSKLMSRIRSKDTKPELLVRRLLHGMGYRYRLHAKELPGRPDLVFQSRRKVVFVHGCFWHRHEGCKANRLPKSRREFWRSKLEGNARRDDRNVAALVALGWRVHIVWECETSNLDCVAGTIKRFLGPTRMRSSHPHVKTQRPDAN